MNIKVYTATINTEQMFYYARYTPSPEEASQKIWFGYTKKKRDKKGRLVFVGDRKPTPHTRSGKTRKEAVERLMSWVAAAYQAWEEYQELTWKSQSI